MIGGSGVIFACEAYIKVPIIAVSTFLQNEDHWLTIIRHAIKYYAYPDPPYRLKREREEGIREKLEISR